MKIKKGKVKLESGDIRVGNFVFHPEKHHVKMCDVNDTISFRISVFTTNGRMLKMAMDGKKLDALQNYAIVMYNALGVAFDNTLLEDLNNAAISCMERHKDLYGIEDKPSDEKNEKDLGAVKDDMEVREEIKEKLNNE